MIGIPPGLLGAVISILGAAPKPLRRREILEELDRRGHRISLAGLNRIVQRCVESGLATEGPDGVRLQPR
jgi:Fe2+ or Zn2+ uptake regulation protein